MDNRSPPPDPVIVEIAIDNDDLDRALKSSGIIPSRQTRDAMVFTFRKNLWPMMTEAVDRYGRSLSDMELSFRNRLTV